MLRAFGDRVRERSIRNTPLTLIVFFCAFGLLQQLGVTLAAEDSPDLRSSTTTSGSGVIALSVYHASFVAEAIRSGINTVPQGQAEAARAIGLAFLPTLSTTSSCRRPSAGRSRRWATR